MSKQMRIAALGSALALASLALAALACDGKKGAPGAAAEHRLASDEQARAGSGELEVATWNIEWLTTRDERGARAPEDYTELRRYTEALDADLIALQEVDGPEAARLVFDPEVYDFHFTRDPGSVQRTGFAWKRGLDVQPNPDLETLATTGRRRGADVTVRWEGRELRLLSIHLKSGCADAPLATEDEACRILRAQLPALEDWVDARAREGIAFAVLGDWNRSLASDDEFWREIDDRDPPNADLADAGAGARPACHDGRYDRYIDHIVLSSGARGWLLAHSFHELVFERPVARSARLSDHCPISVRLASSVRASAASPRRIAATDSGQYVGTLATVCDQVASTRVLEGRSGLTFLNLGAPYPKQPFTVVIRPADRAALGNPEVRWAGKRICVTGTVESYEGKAQIVVRTPAQIEAAGAGT